jgi:hypothetical protein
LAAGHTVGDAATAEGFGLLPLAASHEQVDLIEHPAAGVRPEDEEHSQDEDRRHGQTSQ